MKEHPILFSGEMVKAILDGRKTMTRRAIKLKHGRPMMANEWASVNSDGKGGWIGWYPNPVTDEETRRLYPNGGGFKCPYGQPGDLLWVRETWRPWAWWEGERWVFQYSDGCRLEAKTADMGDEDWQELWERHQWIRISDELTKAGHRPGDDGVYHFQGDPPLKWRPSIHMPRWASRITLEVTGVRVERVRDISEDDAKAEGVTEPQYPDYGFTGWATAGFAELWDKINAERGYSWDSTPWVWVVEFKAVKP